MPPFRAVVQSAAGVLAPSRCSPRIGWYEPWPTQPLVRRRGAGGQAGREGIDVPPRNALSAERREVLLDTLRARFEAHMGRHPDAAWAEVVDHLEANPEKLVALERMEATGGEPDVVGRDAATGELVFVDCATQSPAGRRSLCFDPEALAGRKKNPPAGSAVGMAREMGVTLLTEAEYRALQELGDFDTTTSSWVATPPAIRRLGGALFCDRRYGAVFVYHNGADSYYGARGFRGSLRV